MSNVIDTQLNMIIEGFDIDGVLTEKEERERFIEASETKQVRAIIITGRSKNGLEEFLHQYQNIADASDGEFASTVKILAFRDAKNMFPNADRYIYNGSGFRDRMLSNITGWEFKLR